jgi:hypothetical protein
MANKKIAYIATDNGIDGMEKTSILYATFDEEELKAIHNRDKSKAWRRLTEQIVDVDKAKEQALAKLNGIDRLVLGLPNWVDNK